MERENPVFGLVNWDAALFLNFLFKKDRGRARG